MTRFEKQFAEYKDVPEAVAVNSCSSALLLVLHAAGIGQGDEVITSPLTFCATVNAIIHSGASPVLADVDPQTMNLAPSQVRDRISAKTRAIIAVHFAGRPCEMEELMALANSHGLVVIEDCAHAIETEYHGRKAGTIGDFGCFSFYPTKNVTTGDGGMVLAKDEQHRKRIRILASQGLTADAWNRYRSTGAPDYSVVAAGFKHNMTDIAASIGIHELARVEVNWRRREQIWLNYRTSLEGLPLTLPPGPAPDTRHAYHLFNILVDQSRTGLTRDGFIERMTGRRIGTAIHYRSVAEQPYYQQAFGWSAESFPEAMRIGRQTVSLPISPVHSDADVERVVDAVRTIPTSRPPTGRTLR